MCVCVRLNEMSTAMGQTASRSVLDLLAATNTQSELFSHAQSTRHMLLIWFGSGLMKVGVVFFLRLDAWRMADEGTEQLTGLLPVWKELKKIRCWFTPYLCRGFCSAGFIYTNYLWDEVCVRFDPRAPHVRHVISLYFMQTCSLCYYGPADKQLLTKKSSGSAAERDL